MMIVGGASSTMNVLSAQMSGEDVAQTVKVMSPSALRFQVIWSEDVTEVTANSPMGEALMKARIGETIRVDAPRGELRFEVIEIL